MPSDQEQAQLQQLSAPIGTYQHMPDVAWQMHPSYDLYPLRGPPTAVSVCCTHENKGAPLEKTLQRYAGMIVNPTKQY